MSEAERDPMLRGIETLFGDAPAQRTGGDQPLMASNATRSRWAAQRPSGAASARPSVPISEPLELTAADIEEIFTRPVAVVAAPAVPSPGVAPQSAAPAAVDAPLPDARHRSPLDALRRLPKGRLIAIASAALTVVLVVVAFAVVINRIEAVGQREKALEALAKAEESLSTAHFTAQQAHERVTTALAASLENATQAETALGILPGYVDATALLTAADATQAYRAGLAALEPEPLPTPSPVQAADMSTDDITASIRALRTQTNDAEKAAESLAAALVQVGELDAAFLQSMAVLGAAFPVAAEAALEEEPDADQELRDAVTTAAAAIPAAQAAGGVGIAEMLAYPPTVDALRATGQDAEEPPSETAPDPEQISTP